LATFVILFLVGLFLFLKGWPAFHKMGFRFFTSQAWNPSGTHPSVGVAAVLYWTVMIALVALVLATPFAIATALCINEYAPPVLRRPLTSVIDLLAAVPSVIYGFWGIEYLQPDLEGLARWLAVHASWIPIFKTTTTYYSSSAFVAGVVVGIMIVPIITSISREVFSLAPVGEREGAMALGASRWDVIRTVVLPFGRGGMIGGILLGLGRALGETIAITLIISPIFIISPHILQAGANSVAALITLRFATGGKLGAAGLLAAGFTLFAMTLVVNLLASMIVNRSRSAKGVEL
jgi:phosphate transport system permease protein